MVLLRDVTGYNCNNYCFTVKTLAR